MGKVLGEVINSMGLAPVHLVLHDSMLGFCSNWVSERVELVRSVTLIDAATKGVFPVWVVDVPLVGRWCWGFCLFMVRLWVCAIPRGLVDALRVLLKGKDRGRAVVTATKKVNSCFDMMEWDEGLSGVPMQVLWSAG
uniref:Protein AUXIN RESPONSE 4 n=1 Tax=Cajanus cajan TaxID=3821 RepID=A0A151TYV3_CAJCA|nr:Protein AUXIN RESPONSE 4 [Cajanus cajan]